MSYMKSWQSCSRSIKHKPQSNDILSVPFPIRTWDNSVSGRRIDFYRGHGVLFKDRRRTIRSNLLKIT
jgi:hypothetical protein